MSILENIRSMVTNVANAIGAVIDAYVVICDDQGNYIATHDTYIQKNGTNVYPPFIKGVIRGGVPIVVDNPGNHYLCIGCPNERNCPQSIEVIMPFDYQENTIGYISINSFSKKQSEYIKSKQAEIMAFLEQMGNLIVKAVAEYDISYKLNLIMNERLAIMNSFDSGLLTCDTNGLMTHWNEVALSQLSLSEEDIIGKDINEILPNCHVVKDVLEKRKNINEREYSISIKGKSCKFIVGGRVILNSKDQMEGAVFVIRGVKEIYQLIHNTQGQSIEFQPDDIIGISSEIENLKRKIRAIAPSQSTVLISGETGTGKELVARAIHALSPRRNGPFIAINCAAIPDTLLESELFGYEEGTFTGAKSGGKAGKFEFANGGTVFLDEIGDMSLHLQAKMLRVLQDKTVERIGGHNPLKLDIRVIAATHQDLEKKIKCNEFREDLYYRLNVIPVAIAPLRKRTEDIIPLTEFFISRFNKLVGKQIDKMSEKFNNAILQYDWPGNIRQLQNAIEYAINIETGDILTIDSLPPKIQNHMNSNKEDMLLNLDTQIMSVERDMILKALHIYGRDSEGIVKAANALGVSRSTLYRKAKKVGISIPNIK